MSAASYGVTGTGQPVLVATDITKRFSGINALTDVSIEVGSGELVALIGPNGAGKTTFFNCLLGVLRSDRGEVHFCGRQIDGMTSHARARLGMARTFQRLELFGGMSVREHLWVAARSRSSRGSLVQDLIGRSQPTADENERVDATLELLGLTAIADKPAESLSLGRGRVVELGRALMCEPTLLFLDEPSSGLDTSETNDMGEVLLTVQAERRTSILLVEHDVPMVRRLAERTYVLDCGMTIAEGPTAEVLDSDLVRAAYIGTPVI